jgi:hypothetical protein
MPGCYLRAKSRSMDSMPRSITSRTDLRHHQLNASGSLGEGYADASSLARKSDDSRTTSCLSLAAATSGQALKLVARALDAEVGRGRNSTEVTHSEAPSGVEDPRPLAAVQNR